MEEHPIDVLKHFITDKDYYYEYEDPFDGETTVFVFSDFYNFYSFITNDSNCLDVYVLDDLWSWYIRGTCYTFDILHMQRIHDFSLLELKTKCIFCKRCYSSASILCSERITARPVYGNILVRYTSQMEVIIEMRMICDICCFYSRVGMYDLFDELGYVLYRKEQYNRIQNIYFLRNAIYSNYLGEGLLIKHILRFMN